MKNLTAMKKYLSVLSLLLLGLVLFIASCKDEDEEVQDNCAEGRTGALTLVPRFIHHTRPIPGCRVFIKYGATEFPGEDTSKYDYRASADWNSSYATIDSLSCGDFYVYAVGIDSLLDPSNWVCKGGRPYRTNAGSGVDSLSVYITEGD